MKSFNNPSNVKRKNKILSLKELIEKNESSKLSSNEMIIEKNLDKFCYEAIKNEVPEKTLLLLASIEGDIDTVKLLLEDNIDMFITNASGETPLQLAIKYGHTEIVTLFFEYIKKVNRL